MKTINLNHICKIEGHAHLTLKIENNKVKVCELKAAEGARFFEALVLNENLADIQEIVSRICGICSCSHSISAIQALEEALGIKPDENQKTIRELLMLGERIRSHTTHLYFMSLPDYYNKESALQFGAEHKDKINNALELISAGNKIVEAFGGREMHPFIKIKENITGLNKEELLSQLKDAKKTAEITINIFSKLNFPKIERQTDLLSLKEKDGKIASNTAEFIDDSYKKHLKENIKEYSTSKFVLKDNKPYQLGAIARIKNNKEELSKETMSIISKNKIKINFSNPFHNIICQAIEVFDAITKSIELINKYNEIKEKTELKIKQGTGVSAVEAPRGTLFHEYKINQQGIIDYCNIITPTAQNLNIMEQDIIQLVNSMLNSKSSKEQIVRQIEMLIRAYDPCFSCSTHFLKVSWISQNPSAF